MATAKEKFELAQQRYAATLERHLDNGVNFISRDVYIEPEVVIAPRILASRKPPQGPNYAKNIVRWAHRRIPGPAEDKSRQIQKRFQTFFPL